MADEIKINAGRRGMSLLGAVLVIPGVFVWLSALLWMAFRFPYGVYLYDRFDSLPYWLELTLFVVLPPLAFILAAIARRKDKSLFNAFVIVISIVIFGLFVSLFFL